MEDSFKVKVDKAFGSLTPSSSSSLPSLWSLTDEEVKKKSWLQDKSHEVKKKSWLQDKSHDNNNRDEAPCSSSFNGIYLSNLSLDGEENKQEDEEIKASIGSDCTLDNEDEEDENDLIAIGRDNRSYHLFMKDVKDNGLYIDSRNARPDSFEEHQRDPRAGYMAARLRLQEDEGGNMNSILKRKENTADMAKKRILIEKSEAAEVVPDYIINPGRYTRYTFDCATDVDENSNQHAYMDFLKEVAGSRREEYSSDKVLKSVTFIPRKKSTSDAPKKTTILRANFLPGIDEACPMEEDDMEAAKEKGYGNSQETGRKYRSNVQAEESFDN